MNERNIKSIRDNRQKARELMGYGLISGMGFATRTCEDRLDAEIIRLLPMARARVLHKDDEVSVEAMATAMLVDELKSQIPARLR